jgi:hypothetical protein
VASTTTRMSDNLTTREVAGLIRSNISRIEGTNSSYREPQIQLLNTASRFTAVENQTCPHCGRGNFLSLQSFNFHLNSCQRRAEEIMSRSQSSHSSSAATSLPFSAETTLQYHHPICSPCANPSEYKSRLVRSSIYSSSFFCLLCEQNLEYRSSRSVSSHLRFCATENETKENLVYELTGFWPCCLKMKKAEQSSSSTSGAEVGVLGEFARSLIASGTATAVI